MMFVASCDPSCMNGGTCVGENVCLCAATFDGKDCTQSRPPNYKAKVNDNTFLYRSVHSNFLP